MTVGSSGEASIHDTSGVDTTSTVIPGGQQAVVPYAPLGSKSSLNLSRSRSRNRSSSGGSSEGQGHGQAKPQGADGGQDGELAGPSPRMRKVVEQHTEAVTEADAYAAAFLKITAEMNRPAQAE